jgi:hypothetical protein
MIIKEITNKILEKILFQIKQPENMKKIETTILEPLIKYTYNRIYPYVLIIIILFLLTFILALLILIILLKKLL